MTNLKNPEKILRKIVNMAPRFIVAWHELATAVKEQHRMEETLEILEHALDLDETNAESHYRYAAALATAGKTEESVDFYQKSIDLNPSQVGAFVGLGHVLKTLGNYPQRLYE